MREILGILLLSLAIPRDLLAELDCRNRRRDVRRHAAEGKFFSADPRPDLTGYSYARHACVKRSRYERWSYPRKQSRRQSHGNVLRIERLPARTVALGFACHFSFSDPCPRFWPRI